MVFSRHLLPYEQEFAHPKVAFPPSRTHRQDRSEYSAINLAEFPPMPVAPQVSQAFLAKWSLIQETPLAGQNGLTNGPNTGHNKALITCNLLILLIYD